MKNIAVFSALLCALMLFLPSCEKETLLTVDQTSISFTDAGGSQTVTLTANKPWSASSTQSWCKVSPSSGEEAAGNRISISCEANTTYDARNCTVTFTCAEMTKSITVTQATNNGLQVSQTTFEVTKAAQQLNIEVKANVMFSVEVDSGCKDWVKYNSTKGLTTSTVVLDIAENKSYDGREGKVTLKQDGGSLSSTVTIKQSQLDGLFLTTSEYTLSNEKHTLTVEVSTNVEFDVKPEADWVKYVQTKGLSTKQIVLEVAENDTYDQRETKVNIKQKNGNLSGTITIKQDEKYGILVSQTEYNLSNEAQTIEVEVKYNVEFEVMIPDECKAWIKQVSTKGLSTKNYAFSIAMNETYDIREGSITFKQKNGSLSGTVDIKQAQTDYLEVSKNEYTVDIEGETITIEVTSNVDYTVSISKNAQSWLSKVETKGLSPDKVHINVAAGDDNTDRKGEINISFGDLKRTIVVHQYSYAANTIIQFADEKVKAKLVEAFDTNKDGELSIKEAREVKSIEGVFGAIKTYQSFDEFQFFTSVTEIPASMFEGWRLTSIVFPESIIKIDKNGFKDCSSLQNIVVNNALSIIGQSAFSGCKSLKTINLNERLTYIGDQAFMGCSSLKSITIPKGLSTLGNQAFSDCSELTSVIIKEGITYLPQGLFYNCSKLTDVSLPNTIQNLYSKYSAPGEWRWRGAFEKCSSLKSLVIPNSVLFIESASFRYSGLTDIIIPESVTSLGSYSFAQCKNLKSVIIQPGLSVLEGGTFYGCTNLKTVIIPETVMEIKHAAYDYNLNNTYRGCFESCTGLSTIDLPYGLKTIGYNAFLRCTGLKQINISNSVSTISDYAFQECSSLTNISIPESVSSIGIGLFVDCTNLTSIDLPESIISITDAMFRGCTSLKSIIIPESVTIIGYSAFATCQSLSEVSIPESVTTIQDFAFSECSSLKTIILPSSISSIGWCAFASCINLENINVSDSLTWKFSVLPM